VEMIYFAQYIASHRVMENDINHLHMLSYF